VCLAPVREGPGRSPAWGRGHSLGPPPGSDNGFRKVPGRCAGAPGAVAGAVVGHIDGDPVRNRLNPRRVRVKVPRFGRAFTVNCGGPGNTPISATFLGNKRTGAMDAGHFPLHQ
jgi:hypothetical protein